MIEYIKEIKTKQYDDYWERVVLMYDKYPTVVHRHRFVMRVLKKVGFEGKGMVFDFGCGDGKLLDRIRKQFKVKKGLIGGCDLSERAVSMARTRIKSEHVFHESPPGVSLSCEIVISSEVIEHTAGYREILQWIFDSLISEGWLILTTQSGRIHKSDKYAGHTQHFELDELVRLLKLIGFNVPYARCWGWPFFSIQKFLTDVNFKKVQLNYLEGELDWKRKAVFYLADLAFFVHYVIPYGPQLLIVARKQ